MSAFGPCPLLTSASLQARKTIKCPFHAALPSGFCETRLWTRKVSCSGALQSRCTFSPLSKESSLNLEKDGLDSVGVLGLDFQRPYVMPFGNYVVREAVLDEEYWAAAWLRAEIYSEGQPSFRYIDSHRKRFAEQEFTALKRRCFGKQGQCVKCICLVAVASEGLQNEDGMLSQHTLRDRVVGTLDVSIRQLLRGEKFPKEVVTASLFTVMEPERRCGYIANVCVARSARRQGIACNLLEVAIKVAKSWKLKDLYVHVDINNGAARRLYMKTGFQVVEDAVSQLSLQQEQLLSMCV